MIKIVGLGPGAPEALTYGAIKALEDSDNLFFIQEIEFINHMLGT